MVEAMENAPFAALSDEDLKRDMQTLSEEIRSIKEQLRDDASGLYPRCDECDTQFEIAEMACEVVPALTALASGAPR